MKLKLLRAAPLILLGSSLAFSATNGTNGTNFTNCVGGTWDGTGCGYGWGAYPTSAVGGAGGNGLDAAGTATNSGAIVGGIGGTGGNNTTAGGVFGSQPPGAPGGTGGNGVSGTGFILTNTGSITGGVGGIGGNAAPLGDGGISQGGAGGIGVTGSAYTLTNSGTITGGAGGNSSGAGGAGLVSTGNSTIYNSGTIAGGAGNGAASAGNAISFSGGGNHLTLQSGSVITGNVSIAAGSNDTIEIASNANVTITGNYTQVDVATLRTNVSSNTAYGKLTVSGTATLPSNAKIDVNVADPGYRFSVSGMQNILSAGTLVSDGTFSVTDNSLLFNFSAVKDGNTVDLVLAAAPAHAVLTSVNNQGNTPATGAARALDTIFASDPTGDLAALFIGFTTESQVSNATGQTLPLLTGGGQVAASAALTGMNRVVQARIESNRGLSSGDSFYGDQKFWMKPFGSWADQNDRKGVSGYYAKTGGIAFGADATINPTTRLGVSFAYAKASVDGNSKIAPNAANVDVYQLIGYGSYSFDADTEANFQIGYGQNKNQGHRDLLAFGLRAKADYDSQVFTIGAGVGQTYKLSEQTTFTPSVRADYTWIKDDSYTETGAGPLNLNVKGRSTDQLILAVDGKVSHEIEKGMTLNANLGLGYDALNDQASITAAYVGAPGVAFTTKGLDPSPWLVRGGLGIVSTTQSGMEVAARYDAEYRQSFLNQTASVKFRWAF